MPRKETARHRAVFQQWYKLDRDTYATSDYLVQNGDKTAPSAPTIYNWIEWYRWHDRADVLDAEVERKANAVAVQRKVEMLERHAKTGKVLQSKGVEYLSKHGVDNSASAITAIKTGIDVERKAEGMPDWIAAILGADDDDLLSQYSDLVAQIGGHRSGDETAGHDAAAEGTA